MGIMGKLNQLLGIANNLADSFVSVTNHHFLNHIESLSIEKTKLFEIDLLKETIKPEDLMNKTVKDTITKYKNQFLSEMGKLKIDVKDIEKVSIKIAFKPGKSSGRHYTCNVTITARSKEYTKKRILSDY